MFATMLVVLAMAGAPASTPVTCYPTLEASGNLGITYADSYTLEGGKLVPASPLRLIHLGVTACGALLYTSASEVERAGIRRLNPSVDFDQLVGVGLQVALHEAEHVALDSPDECAVEKATRSKVDGLISKLADPGHVVQSEAAATASDAGLPATYHGC